MRRLMALLALLWVAGGCTALLARQGDPDLSVLRRGADRETIEVEVGRAESVKTTPTGCISVYEIKLGAPKNPRGAESSARFAALGAGTGVSAGVVIGAGAQIASLGTRSGTPVGAAAGVLVGGTVWLVGSRSARSGSSYACRGRSRTD